MKKRFQHLFLAGAALAIVSACGNETAPEAGQGEMGNLMAEFTFGEGAGTGFGGDILATVTVSGNLLIDVELDVSHETEGFGEPTAEILRELILGHQSLEVDVVSGATDTSQGILEAVANALRDAGVDPGDLQAETAGIFDGALPADGTFTTTARGRNGAVEVITTFANGAIINVEVGDHFEDLVFVQRAIPQVTEDIVRYNSVNVDAFSGATLTSAAIRNGVSTAIAEAGGSVTGFMYSPSRPQQEDVVVDVDVAIIGGGLSGIMAAVTAAEEGATVALLEKTALLGGNSLMSWASNAMGNRIDVEAGVDYQQQIVDRFNVWMQREAFRADANLLSVYLRNQGTSHDLAVDLGLMVYGPWGDGVRPFLMTPYEDRVPTNEAILQEHVVDGGGHVFMETRAAELIYHNGVVTGVVGYRPDGSRVTVNAGATIIATGGWGGDADLVYERTGVRAVSGSIGVNRGDGINMAWDIGARVPENMTGGLMLHQTLSTSDLTGRGFDLFHVRMPMMTAYMSSLMRVDHTGARYTTEAIPPGGTISASVGAGNSGAFSGGYIYALLSQSTVDGLIEGGFVNIGAQPALGMPPQYTPASPIADTPLGEVPWTRFQEVLDMTIADGTTFFGETIEDVARAAGFADPSILRYHFDRYNASALAGFDEWFGKNPDFMIPYCQGPFWLIQATYNQLGTINGLVVNTQMQVLAENRLPIPGLFSVGSDASSTLYNNMYTSSGDGIGWATASGYLGGREAARFALD